MNMINAVKRVPLWIAVFLLVLVSLQLPASASRETGSVTVHKLLVDANKELALSQDGTEITDPESRYVYKGDDSTTLDDLTKLNGISFTLTRVQNGVLSLSEAVPMSGEGAYRKTIVTGRIGGVDGIAVFDNLPLGNYLLEEGSNEDYAGEKVRFLIMVPIANPIKTDELLYDIHVYPKNTMASSLRKMPLGNTVVAGGESPWQFTWEIPQNIARGEQIVLTDPLDNRLQLKYEGTVPQVTVRYVNRAGRTYTLGRSLYSVKYDRKENIVTVTITKADAFKALANALKPAGGSATPLLTVDIVAMADEYAMGVIYNSGNLVFSTRSSEHGSGNSAAHDRTTATLDRDPSVKISGKGGLLIYKYDGETKQPLAGAEFEIYTKLSDALAGKNPVTNPNRASGAWPATGADGYATITGLPYQSGGTSYWLVEVQAPQVKGSDPPVYYNLLVEPVEVLVNGSSHLPDSCVEVENRVGGMMLATAKSTVPDGGGEGAWRLRIVGLLLLGLSGVLIACHMSCGRKKEQGI